MNMQRQIASDLNQKQPAHPQAIQKTTSKPKPYIVRNKAINCEDCHLSRVCFNGVLEPDSQRALQQITHHPKPVHKGDHLYRQGEEFQSIYIVRSGSIKLYRIDDAGNQHIAGFFMAGELFGMDGLVNSKYSNSAVALDTTSLCEIPFKQIDKCFDTLPDMQRLLINALCNEVNERQQPLLQLHHKQVEVRLASCLLDLSKRFAKLGQSASEFNLPMSRRDLAQYLGMTEETISRLFTRFQKTKLITVSRRKVHLNKLQALKQLALS